jgi:mono/diheme cytochrome c family protein
MHAMCETVARFTLAGALLVAPAALLVAPAALLAAQTVESPKKGGNPEAAKLKNPVAVSPESLAGGRRVYQRLCIRCHGPEGKGDGEAAVGAQPSDLTGTLQFGSSDGEMFSVIRRGTSKDMESYAERISETDTWNVINYIRNLRSR